MDAGYLPFTLPGATVSWYGRADPDTPRGTNSLLKAIDRLEAALFIYPDRPEAAFALAYCLSYHIDGVWAPKRCEQLLDRVIAESDQTRLKKLAYRLKADLYFPHTGQLYGHRELNQADQQRIEIGYQKRLDVFRNMPLELRDNAWALNLRMLNRYATWKHEGPRWQVLLDVAAAEIESENFAALSEVTRSSLSYHATSIASNAAVDVSMSKEEISRLQPQYRDQLPPKRFASLPESLRSSAVAWLWNWSESQHKRLATLALKKLHRLRLLETDDYLRRVEATSKGGEGKRGTKEQTLQIAEMAKRYRRAGEYRKAMEVLMRHTPTDDHRSTGYAYYGRELAQCYEALDQPKKALETYLHYGKTSEVLYYYAPPSIDDKIRELGGPTINPNRDIDVRYLSNPGGVSTACSKLASDGERLYLVGGQQWNRELRRHEPLPLRAVKLPDGPAEDLGGPDGFPLCVAADGGFVWVETRFHGLWRLSVETGEWESWGVEQGLPTNSVTAVAARGHTAFASVAKLGGKYHKIESGGLVIVEAPPSKPCSINVQRDEAAPQTAPHSATFFRDTLIVTSGRNNLRSLDLSTGKWSVLPAAAYFAEASSGNVWLASNFAEVRRVGVSRKENQEHYGKAWFPRGRNRGGLGVTFFAERDGQLWFGAARPWHGFADSGLYRVDLADGSFHRYGLHDGFRYASGFTANRVQDGVWVNDELWLATPRGLAAVTPRKDRAGRSSQEGAVR